LIPSRAHTRSVPLLLATAAAALLSACASDAEIPEFSGARAAAHVRAQVSHGPRYAGHRGHGLQRQWLQQQLSFRADTLLVQEFRHRPAGADTALVFVNYVARFNPEAPERVLVATHWDVARRSTRSPDPADRGRAGPGANFNASGVAVLVELAELFRQHAPALGFDLLFADGDGWDAEGALPGTRHYLATAGHRPREAVVVLAVGRPEDEVRMDEASLRLADAQVRRMWEVAAGVGLDTVFVPAAGASPLRTAADVLGEAGIPPLLVMGRDTAGFPTSALMVHDLPDALSDEHLGAVGRVLAAYLYGLR
jgi:glutaminyl-peptide cyclotransferase